MLVDTEPLGSGRLASRLLTCVSVGSALSVHSPVSSKCTLLRGERVFAAMSPTSARRTHAAIYFYTFNLASHTSLITYIFDFISFRIFFDVVSAARHLPPHTGIGVFETLSAFSIRFLGGFDTLSSAFSIRFLRGALIGFLRGALLGMLRHPAPGCHHVRTVSGRARLGRKQKSFM